MRTLFFQLPQCFFQCFAGPLFRFPVIIVFQTRNDKKNSIIIAPFSPAHSAGYFCFPVCISPSEKYQDPIHFPTILIITVWDAVLEHRLPIVRSLCFDNNRPSRKNQWEEKEYCNVKAIHSRIIISVMIHQHDPAP